MPGLLDVFAIGFKSEGLQEFDKNLKSTESELDRAEKKVEALEKELDALEHSSNKDEKAIERVKLSLISARADVVKFGDSVKTMQGKSEFQLLKLKKNFLGLMKTVGLLASVGLAVRQSIQMYEQAEQLDMLAQKSNIAVESLQKLGKAAQNFGGSTESVAGVTEQFTTKEFKEKALKVGVSVAKDNPEQTLENIAAKMERLKSDSEKFQLGKLLGLDDGTTRLLMQGVARYREELKRAAKYKLYTKEDIERMKDFQNVQRDIRNGIQSIQMTIASLLLPALTKVTKFFRSITDWAAEHEGGVKIATIFIGIAAGVGALVAIFNVLNTTLKMILANPVILWIIGISAVITGLIAVIQDLIVWANGGESVFKEWFRSMGYDVDRMGRDLKAFFDGIVNGFKSAIEWIKSMAAGISGLGQQIRALWDSIPEPIKKMLSGVFKASPLGMTFSAVESAKKTLDKYKLNPQNSVPAGATQNYYSNVAQNANRNENSRSIAQTRNNNVNIQIDKIETLAKNGYELSDELQRAIKAQDNGFVA